MSPLRSLSGSTENGSFGASGTTTDVWRMKLCPGHITMSGFGLRLTADLPKSGASGPHATLFYSYLKSDDFGALHLYPPIFPDLLAPHPLRALAAPSVEHSPHTRANTLAWTDTIDASPVLMDFSMIAQRTAKDNCNPGLISTKRWWALFWLPWLTVRLYVGLLRSNGISQVLSTHTCVHDIFDFRPVWFPSVAFI